MGLLAAVMTATSIDFVTNARAARMDMLFAFLIIASVTAFHYATDQERNKRALYVVAAVLSGLAVMAKGPAGLFLPLAGCISYLYFGGRRDELRRIPWAWCAAAWLAVVVPWHVAVSLSVTPAERAFYFWGQVARWAQGNGRGAGNVAGSAFLYVPYLLKAFFPWSFFLPAAAWLAWRRTREKRDAQLVLPLVRFVSGLVAFSFSSTKASRYMVPMFPPAAILVGYLWREARRAAAAGDFGNAAWTWLRRSMLPIVVAACCMAMLVIAGPAAFDWMRARGAFAELNTADSYSLGMWLGFVAEHRAGFVAGVSLAAAASIAAAYCARMGRLALSFGFLASSVAGFLLILNLVLIPRVDAVYDVRAFADRIKAASDGGPVGWSAGESLETLFYTGRHFDGVPPADVKAYLESDPRAIVFMRLRLMDRLPEETQSFARVIYSGRIKHRPAALLVAPSTPERAALPTAASIMSEGFDDRGSDDGGD